MTEWGRLSLQVCSAKCSWVSHIPSGPQRQKHWPSGAAAGTESRGVNPSIPFWFLGSFCCPQALPFINADGLPSQEVRSFQFSSVAQSCPTLCDPMDCSRARLPCPSPTPGVYSNSCPSSRWCHPAISSTVIRFSSCLHSFPASGSFQMTQFFTSMAKVLEFQVKNQSFQWISRTDLL